MRNVNFEFKNQVSPRYLQPLFLQLEPGVWYDSLELRHLLRSGGLDVQGRNIILANIDFWSKIGFGEIQRGGHGASRLFRLLNLGKQMADVYSTNQPLFFDVMHFLFYSSYRRSLDLEQAPFWLYAEVCDRLWAEAPSRMDVTALTSWLQRESRQAFPDHDPTFPSRSVGSIFPWLGALTPPFLARCGSRIDLCSERRSYCTPQLFHLAVDLIYHVDGITYDTSLAMDDEQIRRISRVCLLDPARFWEMASLTDMAIRELEVRKGQWGTSLALTGPPRWISLPDFGSQGSDAE